MKTSKNYKNILCIRTDNMGDLLMSSPAIRALKESFNCKITLLTSSMGGKIAPFIPGIDETIVADLPWVKIEDALKSSELSDLIQRIRSYSFEAAVIFTVYSQNPLPAAMLTYMADIPERLAYCRENPYGLLTNWIPDKEPYSFIQHQVQRDLNLVKTIGAETDNNRIQISTSNRSKLSALKKASSSGIALNKGWLILHPGVSEEKREYPEKYWAETGKKIIGQLGFQVVITGAEGEKKLSNRLQQAIGDGSFSLAGLLTIEEFIALIAEAPLVISVNTSTIHIAAATQTPVVVLYALTNPQHTPWQVVSNVLYYSVKENLKSKNQVVSYVSETLAHQALPPPLPDLIVTKVEKLLDRTLNNVPRATLSDRNELLL